MTQDSKADQKGRFVVGIDAGGTSVRVAIADGRTGAIVEEWNAPASADGAPDGALAPLSGWLPQDRAMQIDAVCAGITKITRAGVRERWESALAKTFPLARRLVVPDFQIAFRGAISDGAGLAVIAGTGSVVYGEDGAGNRVRVGGRGWEFGDEGSGAHLTAEILRRTLRALDGMADSTPLTSAISASLGTTDPAVLAERARERAVSEGRGFLVPLVLEAARKSDIEAADLFVGEAGWLAAWVRAAYRKLIFDPGAAVPIATIGGLWSAGDLITIPFTRVVGRWIPEARIVTPDASPTQGAVRLAQRLAAN